MVSSPAVANTDIMWKRLNTREQFSTNMDPKHLLDLKKSRTWQGVAKQILNVSLLTTSTNRYPEEKMLRAMLPSN